MNLKEELIRVISALKQSRIEYALCGGMAVIIHGYPRATRDIDILIRENDLETVRDTLRDIGYTIDAGIIPFDAGRPTETRVFRTSKVEAGDLLTLDLMLTTPILEEVWDSQEKYLVEGEAISVVSRKGLAKMKRLAGRPQDIADLDALGLEKKE